ncbi:MAG: type 1 glutamine amidotransferase [Candidatus Omnitrophica bacterium]|nr:type 1 glutamine amidotransferase [Candidatus Omnitrophota bacterium]
MRIHSLQHVNFEDLAFIAEWAETNDHSVTTSLLFQDEQYPQQEEYDCLIVLGGPMSVHEEKKYPWLASEKRFIENAIKNNKSIVGICLGAQLIAEVLGGTVTKNKEKEIGWFPVTLMDHDSAPSLLSSLPSTFYAFHWHGDTFSIPSNCIKLASNETCENQAFQYNDRLLALQFHLESTRESITALLQHCKNEMISGKYIQDEPTIKRACGSLPKVNAYMRSILEKLARNHDTSARVVM